MKVLHIIHSFSWAGAENNIVGLSKGLLKYGIEPSVLCSKGKNEELFFEAFQCLPIKVIGYDFAKKISLKDVIRIAHIIKRNQYDIVHVHQVGYGGAVGRLAAKLANKKVVATEHNLSSEHEWIKNPFKKWFHNRCFHPIWNCFTIDHIIANSSAVAEATVAREKINRKKITVINLGIEMPPQHLQKTQEELLKDFQKHEINIGFVGRLSPEKGLIYLLKALPSVLIKHHNTRLIIAGDGPERANLSQVAQELNITDKVIFLGWTKNVFKVMNGFDIIVVPSLNEPFGIVVLEAMACRVPIVASYNGGIQDILPDDESCGLLVPPQDSDAISRAILRLILDPQLRLKITDNAFKRFQLYFTDEIMVKKTITVYNSVLQ